MKINLILFVFIFSSFGVKSQSDELGVFLGASYYTGDLNPYKHFNQNTNPAIGLVYRHNTRELRLTYRLHAKYGKIEGYDHQSIDETHKNRNLNFSTDIFELGAIWEVNFFKYELGNTKRHYFSPFIFMGVAFYHFSPQGLLEDDWYELQPLGTEGQNTTSNTNDYYKLNQFSIPFGIGIKVNVSERIGLSFEYGVRKTFTDYLDDVSKKYVNPTILNGEAGLLTKELGDRSYRQVGDRNIGVNRGVSELNDWYYFAGVTVNFILHKATECGTNFR